jgi:hypothetical protein
LSSAFLQIPLKEESRQYTAFLFDSKVYQYKRTPYGFRNSLSAFVRAHQSVLSTAERKYSVCEQELLAVIYALQKFRLYVFGQHVTVYSDNKALSFMKKYVLVSNRITRWIMQIQEYDLETVHIKGTDNFLADLMSRNSVGLTGEQIANMSRPREVMVTKIDLYSDPGEKKDPEKPQCPPSPRPSY